MLIKSFMSSVRSLSLLAVEFDNIWCYIEHHHCTVMHQKLLLDVWGHALTNSLHVNTYSKTSGWQKTGGRSRAPDRIIWVQRFPSTPPCCGVHRGLNGSHQLIDAPREMVDLAAFWQECRNLGHINAACVFVVLHDLRGTLMQKSSACWAHVCPHHGHAVRVASAALDERDLAKLWNSLNKMSEVTEGSCEKLLHFPNRSHLVSDPRTSVGWPSQDLTHVYVASVLQKTAWKCEHFLNTYWHILHTDFSTCILCSSARISIYTAMWHHEL